MLPNFLCLVFSFTFMYTCKVMNLLYWCFFFKLKFEYKIVLQLIA